MIKGIVKLIQILASGSADKALIGAIAKLLGKTKSGAKLLGTLGASKAIMDKLNPNTYAFQLLGAIGAKNSPQTQAAEEVIANPNQLSKMLYTQLVNAPQALINKMIALPEEHKAAIQTTINSADGKSQVFMSSSWIAWGSWESTDGFNGNMTLQLKTHSKNNPSGIYTFYNVPRSVFEFMSVGVHAGTKFWNSWYGIYSLGTGRILSWKGLGAYRS